MPEINIILSILETLKKAKPENVFIHSLHQQYCNRGGLSKKQLEGLQAKAIQSKLISTAKLATLEAIIKKKPTRYKSPLVKNVTEQKNDAEVITLLKKITEKYPQHKTALFLMGKTNANQSLTVDEINEVKRLAGLLLNKE